MTSFTSIYNAIGALSVSAVSVTPTAYYGSTLTNWTPSANLPVRLLLADEQTGGTFIEFIDADDNVTMQWQVSDMMLWKPVAQGQGLHEVTPDQIAYMDHYAAALKANRTLGLGSLVRVSGANIRAAKIEYPAGSGTVYFAVRCVVTVTETA